MTITHEISAAVAVADRPLSFLWAEVTGTCQLSCVHCYAGSGPDGTHGVMTADDWETVLTDAAALGAGDVCFIGGEPTLYPDLPRLVRHALGLSMKAEVYSNLVRVTPQGCDRPVQKQHGGMVQCRRCLDHPCLLPPMRTTMLRGQANSRGREALT